MKDLNTYIDQTILRPDAAEQDIRGFLKEVNTYKFYAAVVHPCWVELADKELSDTIKVCSVVGFPLGASSTRSKAYAAGDLAKCGCDEIDMVMNIGRFKDKDYKYVAREIKSVVEACQGRVVKVIIETCLLDNEEKAAASRIIMETGAQFVKTSTGFSQAGAQEHDVRLLRRVVGPRFGVKASGGIRDAEFTRRLIQAGASRIGTSAGVKIVQNG
jgi:deoxyribose-phosphate aldolase